LIARSKKWNKSIEETFHLYKTKQKSGCPSSKVAKKQKSASPSSKIAQNKQKVPQSQKYQISSFSYNECN
jgi:hypothetical protein